MLRFSLVWAVALTSTMAVSSVLAASPQEAATKPAKAAAHHPARHAQPNPQLASREAALRAGQRKAQAHRRATTGTVKAAGAHGVSKVAAAHAHRGATGATHRTVKAKTASTKKRAGHAAVHGPSAQRGAVSVAHVRHARAAAKAPAKKV